MTVDEKIEMYLASIPRPDIDVLLHCRSFVPEETRKRFETIDNAITEMGLQSDVLEAESKLFSEIGARYDPLVWAHLASDMCDLREAVLVGAGTDEVRSVECTK